MNDPHMSSSIETEASVGEMSFDEQTQAKIAEIEDAIIELTDLCENHDELMAVLRTAIAGKRRENAIFAALDGLNEEAVVALVAEHLHSDMGNP